MDCLYIQQDAHLLLWNHRLKDFKNKLLSVCSSPSDTHAALKLKRIVITDNLSDSGVPPVWKKKHQLAPTEVCPDEPFIIIIITVVVVDVMGNQ